MQRAKWELKLETKGKNPGPWWWRLPRPAGDVEAVAKMLDQRIPAPDPHEEL